MTKLESLLEDFEKATQRLEEVLRQEKNEFIRDSAIQRFEFTFDLCWKTVKSFLEETHGVICASPKKCFREAYKQGLIDYDDFWIELTNLRNQTSHMYKEELADEIFGILPKTLGYFKKILEAVKNENNTKRKF